MSNIFVFVRVYSLVTLLSGELTVELSPSTHVCANMQ